MMAPDSKIVYRVCKCGETVYTEPCPCGVDETAGMEELQDKLMSDQAEHFERQLRKNHERYQREQHGRRNV